MKAYSPDLRQKVLAAALRGDRTIHEVADSFGVGATFVDKVLALHRKGEDLAPRPHGGYPARLLPRHEKRFRCKDWFELKKVVGAIRLCGNLEQRGDELRLPLRITSRYLFDPPSSHHVYGLNTFEGALCRAKALKALRRPHLLLNGSVILLDHIVKVFHAPLLTVLRYDPFRL